MENLFEKLQIWICRALCVLGVLVCVNLFINGRWVMALGWLVICYILFALNELEREKLDDDDNE